MKVFVSNVDNPLGHNLSRLLSNTIAGSRREDEENDEEDISQQSQTTGENNEEKPSKPEEKPPKEPYIVIGSLQGKKNELKTHGEDARDMALLDASTPAIPGNMIETGNKKKDQLRREAIDKISVVGQKPKWVRDAQSYTDREKLKQDIIDADVIIYDLLTSLDEASWVVDFLSSPDLKFEKPKTFVAVSSVMTWAKTKVESDDADAFLAEDEYRRRKPHPNFKNHITVEKNVVKLGKKNNMKAYVIASGLLYHPGNSIFHYLFKAAWHNEKSLLCYGEGSNIVPTIHIDDLTNIIVEVVETTPETKYLVAVDDSKSSLYDITKAISENLGSGAVHKLPKEEAFLDPSLSQAHYDMLTVNLRIDPGHIKDMGFEWKYESGIIENIQALVQEYKDARGFWPIKVYIHGPPASGKTFLAQKIAEHYKIHLIDPEQVVQEAVSNLEARANGEIPPADADDDVEVDRELLAELKEAYKANNGAYPAAHILNFVRDRLRSMPCKNQGYVLDGFPTTTEEANELFKSSSDEEGKDEKGTEETSLPEFVFTIESSDQFVKTRIMKLPESAVAGTRNAEEALTKRLEEFRKNNTDEITVLNYFDELESHPISLEAESRSTEEMIAVIQKAIGKPRNYGPSLQQIMNERKNAEILRLKAEESAAQERERQEQFELEAHNKAVAEWNARLEEIRKQEQEVLEAQSIPLRNYLMKFVMPTLTAGLIEVSKVRPDDPVDYLAEYLFKHNPSNS